MNQIFIYPPVLSNPAVKRDAPQATPAPRPLPLRYASLHRSEIVLARTNGASHNKILLDLFLIVRRGHALAFAVGFVLKLVFATAANNLRLIHVVSPLAPLSRVEA
jgi:hypothetical protein